MSRRIAVLSPLAWLALCFVLPHAAGAAANLFAERVESGFSQPVFLTAPAGDARLFVVERAGIVKIIENGSTLPTPFLDITSLVKAVDSFGFFGMAFAPDYATSGLFYVYYTSFADESVIARYSVSANPNVANAASGEPVLAIPQPGTDHNGGTIAISPIDGYLYFTPGDGGTGPYDPLNNAQDPQELLGKMLRIDVSGGPGTTYTIPPDNPFVLDAGVLDEIWAFGLRNPFRWSFDRLTGDLWMGDVGQEMKEEVNREDAGDKGRNYGWDVMEGTLCNPNDPWPPPPACNAPALTLPFYEYDHNADPGCSGNVIGGYVHRGHPGSDFRGLYFFGDFCTAQIWTLDPASISVVERTGDLSPAIGGETIDLIVGFGEDGFGEIYVVDLDGEVFRIVTSVAVPALPGPAVPLLAALLLAAAVWRRRSHRVRAA